MSVTKPTVTKGWVEVDPLHGSSLTRFESCGFLHMRTFKKAIVYSHIFNDRNRE
jgi:hypothetical protein